MPWELKLEFNDTLCCKLYSKLSYADEDSELTAPPASPVAGFKYPPLVKLRQHGSPVSMQDVIDKCYLYEDIRSQKSNSKRINSLKEGVVGVDQVKTPNVSFTPYYSTVLMQDVGQLWNAQSLLSWLELWPRNEGSETHLKSCPAGDDVPRVQPLLSSRYIRRCNGEKLRSMADSLVTKYYSEGSIFLKESIDDVNEDKELIVSGEKFEEYRSRKRKPKICVRNPKSTVDSRVSFDLLRNSYKGSRSGNKSKEFSGSNIVGRNGVERTDLQTSPYTLFEPSEGISDCTVTKTDKTQSIIVESAPSVEEKDVVTAVWNHALLANRSSNSSHSYYSTSGNNGMSHSKDEKYSFLRRGNILRSNDRTVCSIKSAKLLLLNI